MEKAEIDSGTTATPLLASRDERVFHIHLNFVLVLVLLFILFLLLELTISSGTELSAGNYGRYLDSLWASDVIQHGRIRDAPFPPEPSLFSNANSYSFNLMPALMLVTTNLLTGSGVTSIQTMPIYGAAFFASVVLLANALYSRNQLSVVLAVLLSFFFVYSNNSISREVNRIVLAYTILNMFFFAFIRSQGKKGASFRALSLFLLLAFVLAYSANAVTGTVLVIGLTYFEGRRTQKFSGLNLATTYVVACLVYYLIVTDFLTTGIRGFMRVFETRGFTFQLYLFTRPGIWPSELAYIPHYSPVDWFLLLYPFLILGFLLGIAVIARRKNLWNRKPATSYDSLLFAFVVFFFAVVAINSWALLPTAGLDYIALFGWLGPVLAVGPLVNSTTKVLRSGWGRVDGMESVSTGRLRTHCRSLHARSVPRISLGLAMGVVILLGVVSVFNYQSLPQRDGERVTQPEIAAGMWLGRQDLLVVSDLHFLSTYVTLAGTEARHYLPIGTTTIEQVFYEVNVTLLQQDGVNAFVVTRNMELSYITHFDGTRTIPNPTLGDVLGSQWNLIYDNGESQVFGAP